MALQVQNKTLKDFYISVIRDVNERGGPTPEEYPLVEDFTRKVADSWKTGELTDGDILDLANYAFSNMTDTIPGMALAKPLGYAGDFRIIDKIYTKTISGVPVNGNWDHFSQNHSAPQAVRNRKTYFKTNILERMGSREDLTLLNVASGPARDLKELFEENNTECRLKVDCVEMDERAIAYARQLTAPMEGDIRFFHKNIFKFRTDQKYDVIWSAGLFDYFNDKAFKLIFKKFRDWIKPGGEIIIGNFNDVHNPTRDFMEVFGDWHLIHRSEHHLRSLALEMGYREDQISVGREQENVNLFLHVKV